MIWSTPRRTAAALVLPLIVAGLAGCGALDVSDPTAIEQSELDNANGANLLRVDALKRLAMTLGDNARQSGILADEIFADTPVYYPQFGWINEDEVLDRRESENSEEAYLAKGLYTAWQETRRAATLAMPGLAAYVGQARVGEMFAVRGLAEIALAESYCPGLPLHRIVNYTAVYSGPLTTDEIFEHALADFDSAVTAAADSARILNWARIGRGRALLGLGRFAEAGVAVADVPEGYVQNAEFNQSASQSNSMAGFYSGGDGGPRLGIADREGGNGLDYTSAGDVRIGTASIGMAIDGVTDMLALTIYPDDNAPLVLASATEARLIQAEAAFRTGGDWLTILNDLRETVGLDELTDPGSDDARVDLLFRERAFWLIGTGHRLGDLRRLIARYGRTAETVFPTGNYRLGGTYGTATSIPFPASSETPYNAAITGCTSR